MKRFLKLLAMLAGLASVLVLLAAYFEHENKPQYISIYGDSSENEAC